MSRPLARSCRRSNVWPVAELEASPVPLAAPRASRAPRVALQAELCRVAEFLAEDCWAAGLPARRAECRAVEFLAEGCWAAERPVLRVECQAAGSSAEGCWAAE